MEWDVRRSNTVNDISGYNSIKTNLVGVPENFMNVVNNEYYLP